MSQFVPRARTLAVWVSAGLTLAGCSRVRYSIDRELLLDVSIENKLLLFDAENEVSIALDEYEQVQRRIRESKEDLSDAVRRLTNFRGDVERAQAKNDANGAKLAESAVGVQESKIVYLEASIEAQREQLRVQEALVSVAEAKFELAKAKLVKKNNVRGAADIEIADFEGQVDDYVETARAMQADWREVDKQVEALKAEWLKGREQLQKASGGGLGSAWAEDGAMWGSP